MLQKKYNLLFFTFKQHSKEWEEKWSFSVSYICFSKQKTTGTNCKTWHQMYLLFQNIVWSLPTNNGKVSFLKAAGMKTKRKRKNNFLLSLQLRKQSTGENSPQKRTNLFALKKNGGNSRETYLLACIEEREKRQLCFWTSTLFYPSSWWFLCPGVNCASGSYAEFLHCWVPGF